MIYLMFFPHWGWRTSKKSVLQYHFIRIISSEQDLGYNLYTCAGAM
jgi:hypothetical protein